MSHCKGGMKMIHITTNEAFLANPYNYPLWDYPVEELGYLLTEHDNELFVLKDGRLYETVFGATFGREEE